MPEKDVAFLLMSTKYEYVLSLKGDRLDELAIFVHLEVNRGKPLSPFYQVKGMEYPLI